MKDFFRTFVKILIVFILVGSIVNDIAAIMVTHYYAQDTADAVAQRFAVEYNESKSESAARYQAQISANENEVTLEKYEILPNEVSVTIKIPVKKTIYIERIDALKMFSKAQVTGTAALLEK